MNHERLIRKTSEKQKFNVNTWFDEWKIHQALRTKIAEDEPEASDPSYTDFPLEPYSHRPLSLGDIRLVSPRRTPASDGPVFVAAFSEWRPEGFLVAMFSRFSSPALAGEMRTDLSDPRLQVLSVWTALSLDPEALLDSWHLGTLSPEDCWAARRVYRFIQLGHDLPSELFDRTGLPVQKEEDPRLGYVDQERIRLQDLIPLQHAATPVSSKKVDEICNRSLSILEKTQEAPYTVDPLPMAAADEGLYLMHVLTLEGVYREFDKPCFLAEADGIFRLNPEDREPPPVQWVLQNVSSHDQHLLRGRKIHLLDLVTRRILAHGIVDRATGRVVQMTRLNAQDEWKPVSDMDNLVLVVEE